jgi:hypothetical protein
MFDKTDKTVKSTNFFMIAPWLFKKICYTADAGSLSCAPWYSQLHDKGVSTRKSRFVDRAVNSARLIQFLNLNHIRLKCMALGFFANTLIHNANLH